jgi:hypothetical protein
VFHVPETAAVELIFLGPMVIIAAIRAGTLSSAVPGIFVLVRGHHSLARIFSGL